MEKYDKRARHGAVFTTICAAALALPLFAEQIVPGDYARTFTISFPGYSGATLTNFPVLIRLSAQLNAFDYSKCKVADGGDLRFADAEGNLLASEVDTWVVNGESLVWVKVPTFNGNTVITAHYGCVIPPAVTPSDVWANNGYVGVWHLGQSASTLTAASANASDFETFPGNNKAPDTSGGILWAQDGIVGKSVNFEKRDIYTNNCLRADHRDAYEGMSALTIEAWTYRDSNAAANGGYVLDMVKRTGSDQPYCMRDRNGYRQVEFAFWTTGANQTLRSGSVATDTWVYQAGTYDSSITGANNAFLYIDGESKASASGGNDPIKTIGDSCYLYLGNNQQFFGYTAPFPGLIDEVRISNVARSADWVNASYDTVKNDRFTHYEVPNDWKKYTHTFSVVVTNYTGTTALSAFPVLLKVSESLIPGFHYDDCRKLDGADLRFADLNGNMLDSEVETWNPDGESFVWVSLPTLTNNVAIKAYYGWKFAPGANSANVWSNGFVGVWHMADATLPMTDSVNGGTSLTENQSGATLPGQASLAGKAIAFDQLSTHKGCLETTDQRYKTSGRTDYTVEFWSYQDSFEPTNMPYSSTYVQETGASAIWRAYCVQSTSYGSNGKTTVTVSLQNAKPDNPSTGSRYPNRAEWVYQNFRVSDSSQFYQGLYQDEYRNARVYAKNYSSSGGFTNDTSNTTLFIGNTTSGSTTAFPGMIDEVRISSVARSDDWMNATYDTIKNAEAFVAYSPVRKQSKGFTAIVR